MNLGTHVTLLRALPSMICTCSGTTAR